jgi:hypothetical protein
MYRVRALGYEVAETQMRNRVVQSHIYDVETAKTAVVTKLRRLSTRARRIPTQLWMDEKQRAAAVEAGRVTAYLSLFRYLTKWQKTPGDFPHLPFPAQLFQRVERAWQQLNS